MRFHTRPPHLKKHAAFFITGDRCTRGPRWPPTRGTCMWCLTRTASYQVRRSSAATRREARTSAPKRGDASKQLSRRSTAWDDGRATQATRRSKFCFSLRAWEPTGAALGPVGKEARSTILKTRMFTTERPMPGPLQEAFAHTQLIWSCPQGSAQLFFPNLLLFLRPGSAPQEVQVLWGALESVSCLSVLDSATYTPQSEHNGKSRLSESSVADSF